MFEHELRLPRLDGSMDQKVNWKQKLCLFQARWLKDS
jgi:hypothetical protein